MVLVASFVVGSGRLGSLLRAFVRDVQQNKVVGAADDLAGIGLAGVIYLAWATRSEDDEPALRALDRGRQYA